MRVHNARLHDALAHRGRHTEVKNKNRHEIEKRREEHRLPRAQDASGDHGGNRVGRIMKAIHEVKGQRQAHQKHHHPQSRLHAFHCRAP